MRRIYGIPILSKAWTRNVGGLCQIGDKPRTYPQIARNFQSYHQTVIVQSMLPAKRSAGYPGPRPKKGPPALRKINSGTWRKANGVGDVLIWRAIQSKAASHPDWSQREVAKALHVSKSLINKVLRRQSAGERGPRKHGTGVRRCFSPITIKYMVELLSHEGKGKSNTMRDVQRILKEELGQYWPGG